jgi:hypothetical protein
MNNPFARVKYKPGKGAHDASARYDVGTLWPARTGNGYSLSPQKTNDFETQYPKMKLSEAAARAEQGDGFLDVWPVEQRGARRGYARNDDDSDIPF